jgi:hypothetical protein
LGENGNITQLEITIKPASETTITRHRCWQDGGPDPSCGTTGWHVRLSPPLFCQYFCLPT